MKTKIFLLVAICLLSVAGISAQKVTSLKITTENTADNFSFEGGVFTILNDVITVTYANTSLNKSYAFADVVSIAFETSEVSSIKQTNADANLSVYIDDVGVLQIDSKASQIDVFNVTGAKIASLANVGNSVQFDLSTYPKGLFLVKAGNKTVKVIKQ